MDSYPFSHYSLFYYITTVLLTLISYKFVQSLFSLESLVLSVVSMSLLSFILFSSCPLFLPKWSSSISLHPFPPFFSFSFPFFFCFYLRVAIRISTVDYLTFVYIPMLPFSIPSSSNTLNVSHGFIMFAILSLIPLLCMCYYYKALQPFFFPFFFSLSSYLPISRR